MHKLFKKHSFSNLINTFLKYLKNVFICDSKEVDFDNDKGTSFLKFLNQGRGKKV